MSDYLNLTGLSYFFNKLDNYFIRKSILNNTPTFDPLNQFPIGSIYLTIDENNPSTIFGGTWEAWGVGRALVGVDVDDTDFSSAEMTGGEKGHALTIDEIPAHTHTFTSFTYDDTNRKGGNTTRTIGSSSETRDTESSGVGIAHNNVQPYITCYMWKRTA